MILFCSLCKFQVNFFFPIHDFCCVENKKALKIAAVLGGGYLLFQSLKLKRTAQDLFISPKQVRFQFDRKERILVVLVTMEVINPVGGSINISNIYGKLVDQAGNELGTFQTGSFRLEKATTLINVPVRIGSFGTALSLLDAVQNNRWPVFTMNYTVAMAGGILPIRDKVSFDTGAIKNAIDWIS